VVLAHCICPSSKIVAVLLRGDSLNEVEDLVGFVLDVVTEVHVYELLLLGGGVGFGGLGG
jgi:hypothetical protein